MRYLWALLALVAIVAVFFVPQRVTAQTSAPCGNAGYIRVGGNYFVCGAAPSAAPTATPTVSPTPTASPSPTPIPSGYVIDTAQSGQGFLNSAGVDYGTTTPPPGYIGQTYPQLQIHRVRSGAAANSSDFVGGFTTYYNGGSPNPNNGWCGSISTQIYFSQAQIVSQIQTGETNVTGTTLSSNPLVVAYLGCTYVEFENEFDNNNNWPKTGTLSAATAGSGATTLETIPGTSSCGAGATNIMACGNVVLYVNDGANSEDVLETCAANNANSNNIGGQTCSSTQFAANFQNAHASGTPIYVDVPATMASAQINNYLAVKANGTHPEFASLELTTTPMATLTATWSSTYSLYGGMTHLAGYDAAVQVAALAQFGTACHMWQQCGGSAYLADALNWHYQTGNTYPTIGASSNNWSSRLFNSSSGAFVFATGIAPCQAATICYPFSKGMTMSEAGIATSDELGNGSATVPYTPVQANTNSLPQTIDAEYAATGAMAVMQMQLVGGCVSSCVNAVASLYEPVLADNSATILANSWLDLIGQRKPNFYFRANAWAPLVDPLYNPATFTPLTFAYPNPNSADWCTNISQSSSPYNLPSGCTTFHYTWTDQTHGTIWIYTQRMTASNRDLYPGNLLAQCAGTVNYGQNAGCTPPSPYPTTAPTTYPLVVSGSTYSNVQTYIQRVPTDCPIPSNVTWQAPATPVPDTTPSPLYTTAANTHCGDLIPVASYTPSAGSISAAVPIQNNMSLTVVCTSAEASNCTGTYSPIAMQTPVATPASCPTPQSGMASGPCPWNYYRNGVYSPVIAR